MWDQDEFLTSMNEDSVVGSIVTKVHAIDLDLSENRKISYSLMSSDSDHFAVDSKTKFTVSSVAMFKRNQIRSIFDFLFPILLPSSEGQSQDTYRTCVNKGRSFYSKIIF